MFEIPTSYEIGGIKYKIRNDGDYRTILDCFAALGDEELTKEERLFASLIIFYEDLSSLEDINKFGDNVEDAVKKMYSFFACGSESASNNPRKLIDWERDEQMICSAVNKVAGTEIRLVPYLHWWTFLGYYSSVGEGLLSTVVNIRNKMLSNKKLEKQEKEFKRENPQYFVWNSKSVEQKEADEYVRQIWNSEV